MNCSVPIIGVISKINSFVLVVARLQLHKFRYKKHLVLMAYTYTNLRNVINQTLSEQ